MRNGGVLRVSGEKLAQWLRLPTGTEISDVRYDPFHRTYDFVVRHPDLPRCEEGAIPQRVHLTHDREMRMVWDVL